MTTRERVHQLVDDLSEQDLESVERYLDRLQEVSDDPVQRAFLQAAILPPEKLSPEEAAAVDAALADDEELSHDDVRRLLIASQ